MNVHPLPSGRRSRTETYMSHDGPWVSTSGGRGPQDAALLESIDTAIGRGSEDSALRNARRERPPCWLSLAVADSFFLFHPVYSKNSSDIQGTLAD